jgi:hypothetical protein
MKNKAIGFILFMMLGIIVFSVGCGENKIAENTPTNADSSGKVCLAPSDRNPNGTSELAQLMRTMETQSETWKKEIEDGKEKLSPVPDVYNTLKTAIPTEDGMKNENFNSFADDFVRFSNALVKADAKNRKSAFNTMVSSCLTCHSQMCPGPIKRINKFYFN